MRRSEFINAKTGKGLMRDNDLLAITKWINLSAHKRKYHVFFNALLFSVIINPIPNVILADLPPFSLASLYQSY